MDVLFSHGASGRTLAIPAFWDGGDRFVVRFAPPEPGRWTYLKAQELTETVAVR